MADSTPTSKRDRGDLEDSSLVSSLHERPSDAQKVKAEESSSGKRWTPEQDEALRKAVDEFGQRNWKAIATRVPGRNHAQCLQRWNKVLKPGLVKGHWSYEEDNVLENMVLQGCHSWGEVAAHIPGRTAKQCRERWRNHLDPSINKAPFTPEEDVTIQKAYETLGNRWTQIAEMLPGRTEDAVKLRWKSLNPHQKTNAKPGRPRLMPGMSVTKPRTAAPQNAGNVATMRAAAGMPVMQGQYASEIAVPTHMPVGVGAHMGGMPITVPAPGHPPPLHAEPLLPPPPVHGHPHPHGHMDPHLAPNMGAPGLEIVNPPMEPKESFDSLKDAAILQQLLRSQGSGMLSFGSSKGRNSFLDMSPDELLASGELDEMLRAVSLANVSSTKMLDSRNSIKLADSFTKAMGSIDKEENRHVFQELIEELRNSALSGGMAAHLSEDAAAAAVESGAEATAADTGNLEPQLLHSLDYPSETSSSAPKSQPRSNTSASSASPSTMKREDGGISAVVGDATSGIDDMLDPDMMRPFRNGVHY